MREEITEWQYLRGQSVQIGGEEGAKKASKGLFTSLQVSTVKPEGEGKEYVALSTKPVRAPLF